MKSRTIEIVKHGRITSMEKTELRPVLIRIEEEKYRQLRHDLIDRRETFNALVNKLLDEHMAKSVRSGVACQQ